MRRLRPGGGFWHIKCCLVLLAISSGPFLVTNVDGKLTDPQVLKRHAHNHDHHHHNDSHSEDKSEKNDLFDIVNRFGIRVVEGKDREGSDDLGNDLDLLSHDHVAELALLRERFLSGLTLGELFTESPKGGSITTQKPHIPATARLPIKSHDHWADSPRDLVMIDSVAEPVFSDRDSTTTIKTEYLTETQYYTEDLPSAPRSEQQQEQIPKPDTKDDVEYYYDDGDEEDAYYYDDYLVEDDKEVLPIVPRNPRTAQDLGSTDRRKVGRRILSANPGPFSELHMSEREMEHMMMMMLHNAIAQVEMEEHILDIHDINDKANRGRKKPTRPRGQGSRRRPKAFSRNKQENLGQILAPPVSSSQEEPRRSGQQQEREERKRQEEIERQRRIEQERIRQQKQTRLEEERTRQQELIDRQRRIEQEREEKRQQDLERKRQLETQRREEQRQRQLEVQRREEERRRQAQLKSREEDNKRREELELKAREESERRQKARLEDERRQKARLEERERRQKARLEEKERRQKARLEEESRQKAILEDERRQKAILEEERRQKAILDEERRQKARLEEERRQKAKLQEERRQKAFREQNNRQISALFTARPSAPKPLTSRNRPRPTRPTRPPRPRPATTPRVPTTPRPTPQRPRPTSTNRPLLPFTTPTPRTTTQPVVVSLSSRPFVTSPRPRPAPPLIETPRRQHVLPIANVQAPSKKKQSRLNKKGSRKTTNRRGKAFSGNGNNFSQQLQPIPKTGFQCGQQQFPGLFADTETNCQVFHMCQANGRMDSFQCPKGTRFDQRHLVCNWKHRVNCDEAPRFYNKDIYS